MATIETQLTRDYGVPYRIVAAGMAFVGTTPDLGIAVCRVGLIDTVKPVADVIKDLMRHAEQGLSSVAGRTSANREQTPR
jgi:NAD(P)H-dependent flavin oxidoreductase YrpB (nitropropane dioxygenase family)